jgi:hypothetical protein
LDLVAAAPEYLEALAAEFPRNFCDVYVLLESV